MSWHFLQAEAVACWLEPSLDGAPDALLNLMPERGISCLTVSATGCLNNSQSGMMCEPSTETLGAALSELSRADFLARTLANVEKAKVLPEHDQDYGWKWQGSFAKYEPKLVVVENSPMLTSRGLGTVLGDLAEMGMDARWGVFRASTVGACHHRARLFMVAYSDSSILEGLDFQKPASVDTKESRRRQFARAIDAAIPADDYSSMPRNPDDVARGMDGLKATGNGWVPKMAAGAIRILTHNV